MIYLRHNHYAKLRISKMHPLLDTTFKASLYSCHGLSIPPFYTFSLPATLLFA